MEKLTFLILTFFASTLFGGVLTSQYSLEHTLENGQQLEPSPSVVMLEGGAPTGTIIHPMVAITCAHSTHIPGELVKIVNTSGEAIFSTYVKHAFVPAAYRKAIEEKLKATNLTYMSEVAAMLKERVYAANMSLSFMQFGIERGLQLLKEEKGSAIYSDQESESDLQLLFLTDAIPLDVARPISLSLLSPQKQLPLQSISYGPVYGEKGSLRKMNVMDQLEPYLRHGYVSYMSESNGKLIHTKFLDVPLFRNSEQLMKLGSIVPGDSGSPVFIYNEVRRKWELQGLNVASCNAHAQYLPGVKATICNLGPHLRWITEQTRLMLGDGFDEVGYVPQLVFDHNDIGRVKLWDQMRENTRLLELYPNEEGKSFLRLDDEHFSLMQASADLGALNRKKHLFVVDDQSPFKALDISSRDGEMLVVDWYQHRAPNSVHIKILRNNEVKIDQRFGGTMAQVKLPYGNYDLSIQYQEMPQISTYAVCHFYQQKIDLHKKWVTINKIPQKMKVFEGWIENESNVNLAHLDEGAYMMGLGSTSLPEKAKLIYINPKILPVGFISVEQDKRHENKVLVARHGVPLKKHYSLELREKDDGKLIHQGDLGEDKLTLNMPWGSYLFELKGEEGKSEFTYEHYKHPVLKGNIQALINEQNEALYVATSWGECKACDLSLLADGKYLVLLKDKKKVRKINVLVAHDKLPVHALIADLSGDNVWRVNWFDQKIDPRTNFSFGYEGYMLDAKKSGSNHASLLKPDDKKFNVVFKKKKSRKKERVEFVD